MRIKSPEDIRFRVEGNLDLMVSPALFVPLIENAFKFASYRSLKPAIDINLSSDSGIITFEICNYYERNEYSQSIGHSGYGIKNIKKRLNLSYPGKHNLEITDKDHHFSVKLTINTNEY
jgi:two-component system, LytTR family, sensor kinase